MLLSMSGVRMSICLLPDLGQRGLALRRDQQPAAQPRQRADADVLARSTRAGRCRRSGGRRRPAPPARSPRCRRCARDAAAKIASSSSVWPWPASPARPMISPAWATSSAPSFWRAGRARTAQRRCLAARRRRLAPRPSGALPPPPIAATSLSRSKALAASAATTLPSRITTMRSALLEDLAQQMRDQDAAVAAGDEAAHEGQQLAGRVRVERRCRLVEDDQIERVLGHREGARHLDHLAPADRQVADNVRRPRCRGRERSRRAWRRSARPPCGASRSRAATGWLMRVFSATRQVGAERQFLEHAADAELLRPRHRIAVLRCRHARRSRRGRASACRPACASASTCRRRCGRRGRRTRRRRRRNRRRRARGRRRNAFRRRPV